MTTRARRPRRVIMWAVAVSTTWQENDRLSFLHDGEKPWLFNTEEAAAAKARECTDYRRERDYPPALYEPIRVKVAALPPHSVR